MTDNEAQDVGSASEEAAKLFEALLGLSRGRGGPTASFTDALHDLTDHLGNGEDCRYCPVCRGIALVRQLNPEVRGHLTAAAGSALQAVAAWMQSPASGPGADPTGPDVQRIRLEDS